MGSKEKNHFQKIMHEFIDNSLHRSMGSYFQFGRNFNLSFSQLIILNKLHRGGPSSVSDISRMLDVSNSAVSQLLDKLVQAEYISRWEKPEDRRKKYHSITEKGILIVEKSNEARLSWVDSLQEKINAEEAEILMEALTIMVGKIKQLEPVHHGSKTKQETNN